MQLIDTHAHIYKTDFRKDLSLVVARAQKNYVQKIYMPNLDEGTIERMMEVVALYPAKCLPMVGIHPCYITKKFIRQLYLVEEWLTKSSFIAIGEVGIDLYHDITLCKEQQEALTIQINLAKQYHLPLSIHCRHGFKEMISLLEKEQDGTLRGVIHCFTGNVREAEAYIKLGFCLGIGGIMTMPQNGLAVTIAAVNLQHLVLETDSPYLTPASHRGKRNEPSYLLYIAEKLAEIKQVTLAEVAAITTQNAEKIFEPIRAK